MITLEQRAVECSGWRWVPGMRVHVLDWSGALIPLGYSELLMGMARIYQVHQDATVDMVFELGLLLIEVMPHMTREHLRPDLTDPATLGCLLHLVRDAWSDRTLATSCWSPENWELVIFDRSGGVLLPALGGSGKHWAFRGVTEAEVLVKALEGAGTPWPSTE